MTTRIYSHDYGLIYGPPLEKIPSEGCAIKREKREARLLECAARELCKMRGIDPDEFGADLGVFDGHDDLVPNNWERAAKEITRHNQRADAIAYALRATS